MNYTPIYFRFLSYGVFYWVKEIIDKQNSNTKNNEKWKMKKSRSKFLKIVDEKHDINFHWPKPKFIVCMSVTDIFCINYKFAEWKVRHLKLIECIWNILIYLLIIWAENRSVWTWFSKVSVGIFIIIRLKAIYPALSVSGDLYILHYIVGEFLSNACLWQIFAEFSHEVDEEQQS
jgi:hypothetical protein